MDNFSNDKSEQNESPVEMFFKTFTGKKAPVKDVEEFGKRVSSYIVGQKWVSRPLALSPSVCAQYGWKCASSILLECTICNAKLCTPEPKIESYDAYKACVEKTLKNLKTSHKTHCPWPLAPSPDSFVHMHPMPKEETLSHFLQRFKPYLEFKSSIPQVKSEMLPQLGLEEKHVLSLCKSGGMTTDESQQFGTSAVCMAATGWTLTNHSDKNNNICVTCIDCQRIIWVGSFNSCRSSTEEANCSTSGDNDQLNGNEDTTESPLPQRKRLKKDDFDPLEEHRPWCLWINSEMCENSPVKSEEGSIGQTSHFGYKIFLKSLMRNVCEPQNNNSDQTPSKEHLRSARNLLESWTSPVQYIL